MQVILVKNIQIYSISNNCNFNLGYPKMIFYCNTIHENKNYKFHDVY